MKFKRRGLNTNVSIVDAIQLQADNWGEVVALAATSMRGDKVRKITVEDSGPLIEVVLGAEADPDKVYAGIPVVDNKVMIAVEGDWIVQHQNDFRNLHVFGAEEFAAKYEPHTIGDQLNG